MTLADQVMTRVLLDAGAVPLGASATAVAARLDVRDRSGLVSLRLRERMPRVPAPLPPVADSTPNAG
jgi:hypothetical protein